MLRYHVATHRCELSPEDQKDLERHLAKLERRLRHFDPDLVHVDLEIEYQPRLRQYTASVRLSLPDKVLPARRNTGPHIRPLFDLAFQDIAEQLERYMSTLRREYAHERKRASLSTAAVRAVERSLFETRELLDRALAGDRAAFDGLVEAELPSLARIIEAELAKAGKDNSDEAVQHVLSDVLTMAFGELPKKPARWSMLAWLAWLARRFIAREGSDLAVAQRTRDHVV